MMEQPDITTEMGVSLALSVYAGSTLVLERNAPEHHQSDVPGSGFPFLRGSLL